MNTLEIKLCKACKATFIFGVKIAILPNLVDVCVG